MLYIIDQSMAARKLWQREIDTPNKHRGKNTCEYIVLHHTGTDQGTGVALDNTIQSGSRQVSRHYTVYSDGSITKIGNDYDILWHAGESYIDGRDNLNRYSIGIEVVSNGLSFTVEQHDATRGLIEFLMGKYNITTDRLVRHLDITPRKVDIGDGFWNRRYKSRLDFKRSLQPNKPTMTESQKRMLQVAVDTASAVWHSFEENQIPESNEIQTECARFAKKIRDLGLMPPKG